MSEDLVLVDYPLPHVKRITLNRPEKRNALFHPLRGAIIDALRAGDLDHDIKVMIVRGTARPSPPGTTSAAATRALEYPHYTAPGEGQWPRHVTDSWMSIWDMSKPVIAQVHGYCLAGGSELATGCDMVYMADDAQMGYPAVRFGVPDMHFHPWFLGMRKAMEMMLTGDSMTGVEAARYGWANAAFPRRSSRVRCSRSPSRSASCRSTPAAQQAGVHRQMEAMGIRDGIRAGTELCALGTHTQSMANFVASIRDNGLTGALDRRDSKFGDYRTQRDGLPSDADEPAADKPSGSINYAS